MLIKDEEGKEMILSYLNQGDFIGESDYLSEGQERTAGTGKKHLRSCRNLVQKVPPAYPS